MNFEKINYIYAILEEKSFTKAAKKLYISQPALSKFISKLEEELDIKFFQKSGNTLELTSSGEIFLEKLEKIIKLKNELWSELESIKNGEIKKIKLGIILNRSPYIIPKLLKNLYKKYPNLKVEIYEKNSFELEEMLIKNQLDLAIIPLPLENNSSLIKEIIYQEKLLLITPNTKEYNFPKPFSLNSINLKNERFILLKKNQHLRHMIDLYFKKNNFFPEVILESDSLECILNLVKEGLGMSFVSNMILKDKKWENQFSAFNLEESSLYREYCVSYLKEKKLNYVEKEIVDFLKYIY